MNHLEELFEQVEQRANERKRILHSEESDLQNTIQTFYREFDEVKQIIAELEQNEPSLSLEEKEKLETYRYSRGIYEVSIRSMEEELEKLQVEETELTQNYRSVSEIFELRRKAVLEIESLLQKNKDVPFSELHPIRVYDGSVVEVPESVMKDYSVLSSRLEIYDNILAKLLKDYFAVELNALPPIRIEEQGTIEPGRNPEENTQKEIFSVLGDYGEIIDPDDYQYTLEFVNVKDLYETPLHYTMAELKEQYQQVRDKMKGFVQDFVTENGEKIKGVPGKFRDQFGRLSAKLRSIKEKILFLDQEDYLEITFDQTRYDSMDFRQQQVYVANLILQIEHLPRSILAVYKNGKYIPFEYEELYDQLTHLLEQRDRANYTLLALDPDYISQLSLEEQGKYYADILREIISNLQGPLETVEYNGTKYTISKQNVSLFYETCELYDATFAKLEAERAKLKTQLKEQECDPVNHVQGEELHVDNQLVVVKEDSLLQYCRDHARLRALEKELVPDIEFDEERYASFSEEEKIDYCKNLLNQIFLVTPTESVDMQIDGQKVRIHAKYATVFNQICEKLFDIQEQNLDIKIDEDYVSRLNDAEKKAYYLLMLHDISEKSIKKPMQAEVAGNSYAYEQKYQRLFEKVENRYLELLEKEKEPVRVTKKRAAKFIDKIKKQLKKNTVQLALGMGILLGTLGLAKGYNQMKSLEATSQATNDLSKFRDITQDTILEQQEALKKDVPVEPQITTNYDILGETFTLNGDSNIFENYVLDHGTTPLYQSDVYTTVGVQLLMPDGSSITVSYHDANAKEMLADCISKGAVIVARQAVAESGVEDYLQNGVITGVFREDNITKSSLDTSLKEIVLENVHGRSH